MRSSVPQELLISNEDGLEDLYWLFCTSDWLITRTNLDFPRTKMLDSFVFPRASQTAEVCALKDPNLSSVFSVQTLKTSVWLVGVSPEDYSW